MSRLRNGLLIMIERRIKGKG